SGAENRYGDPHPPGGRPAVWGQRRRGPEDDGRYRRACHLREFGKEARRSVRPDFRGTAEPVHAGILSNEYGEGRKVSQDPRGRRQGIEGADAQGILRTAGIRRRLIVPNAIEIEHDLKVRSFPMGIGICDRDAECASLRTTSSLFFVAGRLTEREGLATIT